MGSFLRKHRELLVVGFLLSFAFLTYASHAGQPSVPGPIRRTVVWVTSPLQRAIVGTVSAAQDAWYGYVDLRRVRDENLRLQAEVIQLRGDNQQFGEVRAENERLRKMVSFAESVPEMSLVSAPVVAFGADPKLRSIRIGRGTNDGLRAGFPVVTPAGLVGRISNVYENSADVLLITDPTSAVAAMTQRTRTRATARGVGDPTRVRLDFIVKSDTIEVGDILLTAASGGLFPKGLILGTAVKVSDNPTGHGLFKLADLQPAVDFDRLEEVQVIVDRGPSAALDRPMNSVVR